MNNLKTTELEKILSMNQNWIAHADNKASLALGFIGVLVTLILTLNDSLINLSNTYLNFKNAVLYSLLFTSSILWLVYSLVHSIRYFFRTIKPKLFKDTQNTKYNSVMHFESIALFEFKDFLNAINNTSRTDYRFDLIKQIHINAKICEHKYNNLNTGLLYLKRSFYAVFALVVLVIIHVL